MGRAPRLFGLSAAAIPLNRVRRTVIWRMLRGDGTVRSRVAGAAAFFLSFGLLAAASAYAQGPQSPTPTPPQPRPLVSGVAHDFVTWLRHVTRTGTHRHRLVTSPPLPRPRPAQLAKAPVEVPAAAVEPNEAQPAATAGVPNNAPGILAHPAAEPDRAPAAAVEPNEAQFAATAVVPDEMPFAPAATVEPEKAPAELPPGAVEQTKSPPDTATGDALQGSNIPD
jgi:hypothetical protein